MFLASKKRIRLSFLAQRAQKMLFWLLGFVALMLAAVYLFLTNRLAIQGYALSRVIETNVEIVQDVERIEASLARFQTREYIAETTEAKMMVARNSRQFVVLKPQATAEFRETVRN
jgi:hypothetical protein